MQLWLNSGATAEGRNAVSVNGSDNLRVGKRRSAIHIAHRTRPAVFHGDDITAVGAVEEETDS